MSKLIKQIGDTTISFGLGSFDEFAVYLETDGTRFAPRDSEYFSRLLELSDIYGAEKIYEDFVRIYDKTTKELDPSVLMYISDISLEYKEHTSEIDQLFTILYAGMIAEENKEGAILKKRVKRLGLHQVLHKILTPEEAANCSKGVPWKVLDILMKEHGI